MIKNPLANAGGVVAMVSIPGSGRTSRGGNGTPLWCSCLEYPMDRGAWWATVHGTAKSWTRLQRLSTHTDNSKKWLRVLFWAWNELACTKALDHSNSVHSYPPKLLPSGPLFCFIFYVSTAAAKSIQSCPTLCDPIGSTHQAPSSLGFSRQEHWSGLPFPSPALLLWSLIY